MASPYTGSLLGDVVTDPLDSGVRNTFNSGPALPRTGNSYNLGTNIQYVMRGKDTSSTYRYWTADFPDGTAVVYTGPNQPLVDVCVFRSC